MSKGLWGYCQELEEMYVFSKILSLITNGGRDRQGQFTLRMVVVDDDTHPVFLENISCLLPNTSSDDVFKEVVSNEFMLCSDNWNKIFVCVCECMYGYMLIVKHLWKHIHVWTCGVQNFIDPEEPSIFGFWGSVLCWPEDPWLGLPAG